MKFVIGESSCSTKELLYCFSKSQPYNTTQRNMFHRLGYEKQIKQMEVNNNEMQSKLEVTQQERDAARSEATNFTSQMQTQESNLRDTLRLKEELQEEVTTHRDTICSQKVELEAEKNKIQTLSETVNTLQNNILNLQKQVEGLNETCSKLARDLETESKLRVDTQAHLTQIQQLNKQLEEQHCAREVVIHQLKKEKEELYAKLQTHVSELDLKRKTEDENVRYHADRTDPPIDRDAIVEQVVEKTPTNVEQRTKGDEVTRLKAVLGARDEDLSRSRLVIKDLEERLRQVPFPLFIRVNQIVLHC